MNLKEIVPEIIVSDITKSIEFYTNNLGFYLDMTVPENTPYAWCQLSLNNINIMMQEHYTTREDINNFPLKLCSSNLLVLKNDSIEKTRKLYNTLKNRNVNFFIELRETDYGTVEFGILDPDSYMILISAS